MENIIEINNLTFKYNNKNTLFEKLNVDIEKGKITTLLGKNGCGKSTLIKLLAKKEKFIPFLNSLVSFILNNHSGFHFSLT